MTPLMESRIIKGPDGPPHSIFINLGTNDIVRANPDWRSAWNRLMTDTASIPCEVLFTINPFVNSYAHGDGPTVQDINGAIAEEHAAQPTRVHIIDWGAAVRADHAAIHAAQAEGSTHLPPPLIRADGIHPTVQGQRWIAQHIESTLDTVCRQ